MSLLAGGPALPGGGTWCSCGAACWGLLGTVVHRWGSPLLTMPEAPESGLSREVGIQQGRELLALLQRRHAPAAEAAVRAEAPQGPDRQPPRELWAGQPMAELKAERSAEAEPCVAAPAGGPALGADGRLRGLRPEASAFVLAGLAPGEWQEQGGAEVDDGASGGESARDMAEAVQVFAQNGAGGALAGSQAACAALCASAGPGRLGRRRRRQRGRRLAGG